MCLIKTKVDILLTWLFKTCELFSKNTENYGKNVVVGLVLDFRIFIYLFTISTFEV